MKNEKPENPPIYLKHTPGVICEQVLWLIKNSGLSFQVKETPFSLDISLKKKFVHHWNQSSSSKQPPYARQCRAQPQEYRVDPAGEMNEQLHTKLDSLKSNLVEAIDAKNEASKDLLEIDKAHRKLLKENRDLLKKHEQVCSESKILKSEKETIVKENKKLSVSLSTCRKDSDNSIERFVKEKNIYLSELEKLNRFKIEKDAEDKKNKKLEKKARQRDKKGAKKDNDKPVAYPDNIQMEVINYKEVELTDNISKETLDAAAETGKIEVYTSKSEDPRFLDFPEHFIDWSEEQKKDAYENNFSLYLKKWLKSPEMRLNFDDT